MTKGLVVCPSGGETSWRRFDGRGRAELSAKISYLPQERGQNSVSVFLCRLDRLSTEGGRGRRGPRSRNSRRICVGLRPAWGDPATVRLPGRAKRYTASVISNRVCVQCILENGNGRFQRRRGKDVRENQISLKEWIPQGVGFQRTQHVLTDTDLGLDSLGQWTGTCLLQVIKSKRNHTLNAAEKIGQGKRPDTFLFHGKHSAVSDLRKVPGELKWQQHSPIMVRRWAFSRLVRQGRARNLAVKELEEISMLRRRRRPGRIVWPQVRQICTSQTEKFSRYTLILYFSPIQYWRNCRKICQTGQK